MKTRNNLVSNSSSTSFILAYKVTDKCPTCGRSDHDLGDLFETLGRGGGYCSDSTELEAKGYEAIKNHLHDEYHTWSPECEKEIMERIDKFLKDNGDGWELIACQTSYHDDVANDLIREKEANGSLIKIWNDHE